MHLNQTTIASFSALLVFFGLASRSSAQTALSVSPAKLTFTLSAGGPAGTQNLIVTSSGGSSVGFTLASFSGSNWLAVTPASGSTPASVTVSANPGSLTPGPYTGFISISSGLNSTTVPVTLTVNPIGISSFAATPVSLTFNVASGDMNTQTQAISITGSGAETFTVTTTTSDGGGWLSVDTDSGVTPATISVTVDPSSLTDGSYYGSIAITADSGTALVVPVQVNIALQGVLNVSPQQLTFAYQLGTASAAQTLTLTTTLVSSISFTAGASSQQCGGNWLTVSPLSGSAPATLNVQLNTIGLQAGMCSGTINISTPSAASSTISIPVNLQVTTSGLLQIATSGVSFNYQVGSSLPAAQIIQVTSASSGVPLTVNATPASGGPAFLDISPAAGSTPQAITFSLDMTVTENLAPGTYTETVALDSPGSPNATVSIPVTLVVSNNPILLASQSTVTFNYQIGQDDPADQLLNCLEQRRAD